MGKAETLLEKDPKEMRTWIAKKKYTNDTTPFF
jgi:hypothetical protein